MESINSKRSKIIIGVIFTIIAMLIWYSSEVSFMSNYKDRPDKWHLIYPMAIFYLALFIEFSSCLIVMYDHKKVLWDILIFLIITFFGFANLNNPSGNSQEYGYVGLIIILASLIFIYFKTKKE